MNAGKKIKKVVVLCVRCGTAGWLTANHLGKKLHQSGVEVTLIESSNIPTIGVGEGTVPEMRNTLKYFGIRETDFIKRCNATFKQSIKFVDWGRLGRVVEKKIITTIFFDQPYAKHPDISAYWLKGLAGGGKSFVNAVVCAGNHL